MPLLLRPTAPSPSIDELAFVVTAASLSEQALQRSVSSNASEARRCTTHSRVSVHSRCRGSTASTDTEFAGCDDAGNNVEHCPSSWQSGHQALRQSGVASQSKDTDIRESKRLWHETQPDDDHISSFVSEAGRPSSLLSCGCSCTDANELGISSSFAVIEDRQLAVVDKELRDLRQTFVRKLYSRLTKISGLRRRKTKTAKPLV
ncbi:unnamed protein product [Peronospora farinosa]|uniref:Uncharacterized protein n=1 Tax=Peronospora farinosa TaxID=134698 RepID=A0AAV0TFT0_9STRA|nr:unnamed protein product [Peronospora farinosa]CAI5720363.1 unnamed protein product [Peronospora farinosa]